MNCACSFDPWLRTMLSSATAAPLILLALILIWWGTRVLRREKFLEPRFTFAQALLYNSPAVIMYLLAVGVIIAVTTIYLRQ